MPQRLKITPEGMQALLERLYARAIIADDYELIIAIVEAHVLLDTTLKEKQGTIMKLLRMLFGAKTEKKKTDPCRETEHSKGKAQRPWQKRPVLLHGKQKTHGSAPVAQKRGPVSRMP